MKKIIVMLLCLSMLGAMVSCNESDNIDLNNNTSSQETIDYTIVDTNNVDNIEYNPNQDTPNDFSKLNFYDMNSSYDSFYINRNPVAKYAITDDSKLCVYIPEWNEYRIFPYNFEKFQDLINCVNLNESQGILINEAHYKDISDLNVLLFSKGSDEIVECKLNLDRTIHLSGLFCNFLDENNGYIFVFEETTNDFLPKGCDSLAFLFKTHDGGETWTKANGDDVPMVPSNEKPIIAEFIDDNIGIISCRYAGSDIYSRTFFTSDGGKTWKTISTLPYNFEDIDHYSSTSVSNFLYIDGEYWLTVRVKSDTVGIYYLKFMSADLNSWILSE